MDDRYIMRNVYAAIIHMAIYDWFVNQTMRDEIRDFFKSDWGIEMCDFLNLSARDILDRLENGKINTRYLKEAV